MEVHIFIFKKTSFNTDVLFNVCVYYLFFSPKEIFILLIPFQFFLVAMVCKGITLPLKAEENEMSD